MAKVNFLDQVIIRLESTGDSYDPVPDNFSHLYGLFPYWLKRSLPYNAYYDSFCYRGYEYFVVPKYFLKYFVEFFNKHHVDYSYCRISKFHTYVSKKEKGSSV